MADLNPPEPPQPLTLRDVDRDMRLYVPDVPGWSAHIQSPDRREYCYFKQPGEDWFHLLVPGELYLQFGETKFCLNCAMRHRHLTDDRLYWQNEPRMKRSGSL